MESHRTSFKGIRKHAWLTLFVVTLSIWLFPIAYQATRVSLLTSSAILWVWGAYLVRRKRRVSIMIAAAGLVLLGWVCSPGRPFAPSVLQQSNIQGLKEYEGTRYVWGGENRIGIDCSGLVRRGLINANIRTGFLTLNPRLIREAIHLWWNDCSAMSLRDGYRSLSTPISDARSINSIDVTILHPGDLAVTANGVHVLAYLGGMEWIEADPGVMRVLRVQVPSDNVWFTVPVKIVRWTQLR